ncbi:OLC1v1025844C1 [Oldenlandia corymbosa var. corymbosa]|uniref:OLC1v1025844C1 n=1 Tax=Oldenlandia corymbosa var. corymbosa TaxID=529605 RepID=A0AAV1C624_OLDCO|nr:OLC1v1025844C1 [Oldenlandia corymbosa var. corymbosa]
MAYIPPHKRQSGDSNCSSTSLNPVPTPTPESLSPLFQRTLNLRSSSFDRKKKNRDPNRGGPRIVFAPNATSKWFPVGLASSFDYSDDDDDGGEDDSPFMSLTKLEPFSLESYERKFGAKPRALVLNYDRIKEYGGEGRVLLEDPWRFAAENLKDDFLSAIQKVKDEIRDNDSKQVKPALVARFGRVIFRGAPRTFSERNLGQLKGSFHTNVSPSFVEHVIKDVIPKLETVVELEKEKYVVQLSDNLEPDSTLGCTCTLSKDGKSLQLYKIQWNQVRHLVADMSCLGKRVDLRLMLYSKITTPALTDDEMKCIQLVIGSAIVDPEVKGGLRWPLGTNSSGGRYTVVSAWHTHVKSFKTSSIRLKVQDADRFDFGSSLGEVSREVTLRLYDIISNSQELPTQDERLIEMLKSNFKLIWDCIL